jgi:cytochrome b involved in lipid metabolism
MPHNNNNVTQLTDSSDESSVDVRTKDRQPTSAATHNTGDIVQTNNNIMTMTSFEEDGSISCDVISTENPTKPSRVVGEPRDNGSTRTRSGSSRSLYPPKRNQNQRWIASVLGIAVLVCFGVGVYFFLNSRNGIKKQQSSSAESAKSTNPITMEELMVHNEPTTDCWLLIYETVYDLTEYALRHPGGPEYLYDFCGTNATKEFKLQHPKEYLNVFLSENTVQGTIKSTTSTTTSNNKNTTDTSNTKISDSNVNDTNESENDDEGDDSDAGTVVAPTNAPISTTTTSAPTPSSITVNDGTTSMPTSAPIASCISLDEVSLHSTDVDCYYILYGYVYDVTNYIDLHPGGATRIINQCGTDATDVYSSQRFHDEDLLVQVNAYELYGLGYAC